MRVWIENPFDNLPLEGFRPQRYWLMAEAFARAGHETTLWTADFNHTTKARRTVEGEPQNFKLCLVSEPPYGKNVSLRRMLAHWRYAKEWERRAELFARENGRPDAIVASSPPLSAGCTARRLAAKFGARLVIDVMDAWPETFERVAPKWALAPLRRMARANYLGADAITTVADRYIELVREYGYREKAKRFYHGIDLGQSAAQHSGKSTQDGLRLAYVGNLGRTYDLATVVRAVSRLDNATLDIAGKGDGEVEIKALSERLGLQSRVRFWGYLDECGMSSLLANCNIGVIPMSADSCVGVPYKLCDYAKHGLAIASSLGGESADLIARYKAGAIYRPSDSDSLVSALKGIDVEECGKNARRMAEAELDALAIYRDYVNHIEKLGI